MGLWKKYEVVVTKGVVIIYGFSVKYNGCLDCVCS